MNPPPYLSDFSDLDTETLMQYLPGVNFPAEKEQVASTAESNNAPQEMVWRIRNARTQRYDHPDNVVEAVTGRRVF
jgi:Protein of unknown function (DUF2795)